MKKVLLLGGAYSQIPSIKKAKELGYYTITCDYLPDNPGHKYADEYYNVSTTDKEAVLELAQKLKIDGIVAYASDPAAPTAAYVAEKMGLAGHPYKSVEILSNKDLFRKFLKENGFNTLRANGFDNLEEAKKDWDNFKKPVMVKPVDSSGSKGITKINDISELENAFNYALTFSRAKRIVIEEYIEADNGQILGEGFSYNGSLDVCLFIRHKFDSKAENPYTPEGGILPIDLSENIQESIRNDIQKVLNILNMKTGAYNFEIRINNEKIYLMEIAPRNGGNMIPQLIKQATGFDMVEATIKSAVGDVKKIDKQVFYPSNCCSYYVIHSNSNGVLKKITVDIDFKNNNLVKFYQFVNEGDNVSTFTGAHGAIGIMILKFETKDEMLEKMDNMGKYVKVIVE